jgi:hypothetical protein
MDVHYLICFESLTMITEGDLYFQNNKNALRKICKKMTTSVFLPALASFKNIYCDSIYIIKE